MMSLPTSREELRKRWELGERFTFLFFYGHQPPESGVNDSCFSQWFFRPFNVDGVDYLTAEHWMMAEKARLFGDLQMLESILNAKTPRDAKSLGRKVQGFDSEVWDDHKFEIVRRGNYEKFKQHRDLKNYLLGTRYFDDASVSTRNEEQVRERPSAYRTRKLTATPVILVEAAGRDVIWGIGLGRNNPKAADPMAWRGRNLLGFALTLVREQLVAHKGN